MRTTAWIMDALLDKKDKSSHNRKKRDPKRYGHGRRGGKPPKSGMSDFEKKNKLLSE